MSFYPNSDSEGEDPYSGDESQSVEAKIKVPKSQRKQTTDYNKNDTVNYPSTNGGLQNNIGSSISNSSSVSNKLDEMETFEDEDIIEGCCRKLKLNYCRKKKYPRKCNKGYYKIVYLPVVRMNHKHVRQNTPCKTGIKRDFFKKLYLVNNCRGVGGYMSKAKRDSLVNHWSKKADNCSFIVGKGKLESTYHNMDCTVGARMTGISSSDVANECEIGENARSGSLVDGIVIPEDGRSYSRDLNEDFMEKMGEQRLNYLRSYSKEKINNNLQYDKSDDAYMVTIGSKVYDFLSDNCKKYSLNRRQMSDPSVISRGKIHISKSGGNALRSDLDMLYNGVKKHQHRKFDVELTPHTENSNWEVLHHKEQMSSKSTMGSYKKKYTTYPTDDKEYKAGFKVTIYIKFV